MSSSSHLAEKENTPLAAPHTVPGKQILASLQTSIHGLTQSEIAKRLQHYGRNTLPALNRRVSARFS